MTVLFTVKCVLSLTISHKRRVWTNFSIGQRHGIWIVMCQSVPSYRLQARGTYQPMIISREPTNITDWRSELPNYCGNHTSTQWRIKPAIDWAYSKEHCMRRHRKWDKRYTMHSRDQRSAQACHVRLGTSHKDSHSNNRTRTKKSLRGLSPVITAERQVSVICALTWYTRRRIRNATMFF